MKTKKTNIIYIINIFCYEYTRLLTCYWVNYYDGDIFQGVIISVTRLQPRFAWHGRILLQLKYTGNGIE